MEDAAAFVDIPSIIVVVFGVTGATFAKWPLEVLQRIGHITMKSIFFEETDPKQSIEEIVGLAEMARRESVFALEKIEVDDRFLKKAMTLGRRQ